MINNYMKKAENAQKCSEGNREEPLSKIEKTSYRSRKLVFTSFDDDEPYHVFENDEINENQIKFLVYGREKCPKTGKNHFQGFVYFYDKTSIIKAKKILKIKNGWFQYAYSGINENIKYCSKEGNAQKFGTPPQQGKRKDLEELRDDIIEGKTTVDDICLLNPMIVHQYGRTLDRIEKIVKRKQFRNHKTTCDWYFGLTGRGKTHKWKIDYNPDTHYMLCLNDNGFWCGYKGQETVVINELRHQLPYSLLLEIIDDSPFNVKGDKCGDPLPFISKHVIITSSLSPIECFPNLAEKDSIDQLLDRINLVWLNGPNMRKEGNLIKNNKILDDYAKSIMPVIEDDDEY